MIRGSAEKMGNEFYHTAASSQLVRDGVADMGYYLRGRGKDGIVRTWVYAYGYVNGKNGVWEYIIQSDATISHWLFKPLK
jgi:hypothetical protein